MPILKTPLFSRDFLSLGKRFAAFSVASSIIRDLNRIRQTSPLVHNVTNYVAMQPIANMLLALGAAPLMAHAPEELEEISKISQALVLNIGTLDNSWLHTMHQAQNWAAKKAMPIILDPVGAGASRYRTQAVLSLLKGGITVLRGNASEIMALVDKSVVTKGVEATVDSLTAQQAAEYIAKQYACVTVVSGATDLIVDAQRRFRVHKPPFSLLTKVTAMGCSATAMIGAFAAINQDYTAAAVHAMTVLGVAGEKAMQHATGPGTFFPKLLDTLYGFTTKELEQQLTVTEKSTGTTFTTEIALPPRLAKSALSLSAQSQKKPKMDYSLYLVADCSLCSPDLLPKLIEQVAVHGVSCVQLRGKTLTHDQMIAVGEKILAILNPLNIPLIVNDAIAVAKKLNAAGVHLGQKDSPVAVARKELGEHKIIGLSIENEEQALQHAAADVDYFGVGPIFATPTKPDAAPPIGLNKLKAIRAMMADKPLVAIGGINRSNITSVMQCGIDGAAVVSAILAAKDQVAATQELRHSISTVRQKLSYRCVVTIAGSDSSGGAGIQADLKTISATGGYAASVITALTAQNTVGVMGIHEIPAAFVGAQIDSIFQDLTFSAVKIGMVHTAAIIAVVADRLKKWHPKNVVLDPVMVAKSGNKLITDDALKTLKEQLLPLAFLITPNLPEAETLLQHPITSKKAMEEAAQALAMAYHTNVLIKGGHLTGTQCDDVLFDYATKKIHWFSASRIISNNTHGTGCTFSAAIASYLAQGDHLSEAIANAKKYLTIALEEGKNYRVGQGHGPVHHFASLWPQEKLAIDLTAPK